MLKNKERSYFIDLLNELHEIHIHDFFRIGGSNCWPLIRVHTGYSLLFPPKINSKEQVLQINQNEFKVTFVEILWMIRYFLKTKLFAFLNIFKRKRGVFLFGYKSHYYSYSNNDIFVNAYISTVKNKFVELQETVEEFIFPDILESEQNSNVTYKLYQDLQQYHKIVFKIRNIFTNDTRKAYHNSVLVKNFLDFKGINKSNDIAKTLYKLQIDQEIKYNTFKDILKKFKPKLVWTYCFYDNRVFSLIRAANYLNIKNVEYQHSVQGDHHIAYSKWQNPDLYSEWFPKAFWVWKPIDGERIIKNFKGSHYVPAVVCGGNLNITNEDLVKKNANSSMIPVLVSLQGQWIPDFLEKFIEKDTACKWFFRLHPRYPSDKLNLMDFKRKFPEKIVIDEANALTLFEVFKIVEFNITDYSGVALEADDHGIINIIVGDLGAEVFRTQIDNLEFLYADNISRLNEILYERKFDQNFKRRMSEMKECDISDLLRELLE